MTVTFVCTGNTCRSPMGEAILKSLSEAWGWDTRVFSAGLFASPGAALSENARTVLARAFRIESFYHSARPMTRELFSLSDLVVGMTRDHARILRERYGDDPKIISLPVEVGDPWGGDLSAYEKAARAIAEGVCRLKDEGVLHA